MMSYGWLFLAAMIGSYGIANLLQSVAAAKTTAHDSLNPRFLLRLCRQPIYVVGLLCQFLGFLLAVLARRDLPLFLVQSAVAAGLGVTALLGVLALNWRLPPIEIGLLLLLGLGLAGLVVSASPHPSRQLSVGGIVLLVVVLGVVSLAGLSAARLRGVPGSVVLGALAGIAFGGAAVASRPLANITAPQALVTDPLLYLLVAFSLVGQLLLGLAMQRGSTTAAVAAMDAAAAVPAAIIGLLFLGDQIAPGRAVFAGLGFLFTLGAVIGLSFFAEAQHGQPLPVPGPVSSPALATRPAPGRRRLVKTATARATAARAAVVPATAAGASAARSAARAARAARAVARASAKARALRRSRLAAARRGRATVAPPAAIAAPTPSGPTPPPSAAAASSRAGLPVAAPLKDPGRANQAAASAGATPNPRRPGARPAAHERTRT